ncbi:MAG TPA: FkbM family methyltransferase [Sphingomicrobium sp.]|nr:FkbM family methyltransferase [Sphingomicrobium sp.]
MPNHWHRALISRFFHRASTTTKVHLADLVCRSFEEITYDRLAHMGFKPKAIIDVGAFRGDWTRLAQRQFGPVPSLMAEAQGDLAPYLKQVVQDLPDVRLANCLLGSEGGQKRSFFEMGTGSSMMPERSDVVRKERMLVTRTLDDVVGDCLPDAKDIFLKIDVQGAELEVLRGGRKTLGKCSLVQLEVALLQYNEGAPLMPETVAFMAERNFLPIEISGFSRPRDRLVQIDMLFAPVGSPLRPGRFIFD